jgi:hypothetical protein
MILLDTWAITIAVVALFVVMVILMAWIMDV